MHTKHYAHSRRLAIVAGVAATAGAILLLLSDAISTGHWTLDHAMTPLIVGLTVASGHLVGNALRARRPLAVVGFSVAFLVGTGITVLNGVGRQAEGSETKAAEVAKSNQAIADKEDELKDARARLAMANTMADKEMTGQRCLQRCEDWRKRAREVSSHIAALETQLNGLGAVKPVNAKAAKAGEIAAVSGFDGDRAKASVTLLEPTLVPFLLEWMAIAGLGFGFGHRPGPRTVMAATSVVPSTVPVPRNPVPPKGRRGRRPDPKVVNFVSWFREKHGRAPRGAEIRSGIPGIATSTAYDHAKRAWFRELLNSDVGLFIRIGVTRSGFRLPDVALVDRQPLPELVPPMECTTCVCAVAQHIASVGE